MEYEKIRFYVQERIILELNLKDARFDKLRRNLYDFINDSHPVCCTFSDGSDIYYLTMDLDYGYVCFVTKDGKESPALIFNAKLLMWHLADDTQASVNHVVDTIKFGVRSIDMRTFLLTNEIEIIKDALK